MKVVSKSPIVHIGGRIRLDPNIVAYFEASSNYTVVHLHTNEKLIVATTLGKIEDRVANFGCFIRPNRGFLVNAMFVESFNFDSVSLQNALTIEVPRRKKQLIFTRLSSLIN